MQNTSDTYNYGDDHTDAPRVENVDKVLFNETVDPTDGSEEDDDVEE